MRREGGNEMGTSTITVTSLKLDGYSIPVPVGLSELLSDTWSAEKKKTTCLNEYEREVIRKDSGFVTYLTKK